MLAPAPGGLPFISTDHRCENFALLSLWNQIQLCNKRPQLLWSWIELILIRSRDPWNLQGLWPTDQIIRNTEKIDEAAMMSRDLVCLSVSVYVSPQFKTWYHIQSTLLLVDCLCTCGWFLIHICVWKTALNKVRISKQTGVHPQGLMSFR